jgi:hypothetical protein
MFHLNTILLKRVIPIFLVTLTLLVILQDFIPFEDFSKNRNLLENSSDDLLLGDFEDTSNALYEEKLVTNNGYQK